jgi:plasmid stability protein
MPSLLIRDLPDDLHQKLKERAARNRRSLNKETVVILEMALSGARAMEGPELPTPHRGHFLLTDEWIDQAKREGRP